MPKKIKIIGKDLNLDEVIEGRITLRELIEKNRFAYRQAWKTWLPKVNGEVHEPDDGLGRMAYVPVVAMRKCFPNIEFTGKVRDVPYFVFILNQGRENRPKSGVKTLAEQPKEKHHCRICQNILKKGMILDDIDDYYLTPNGYPYHMNASLLVKKGETTRQGDIDVGDITTWMKTSILLDQIVFFNTIGAGASIKEHQHAQVVDPTEIRINDEVVSYPMLNPSFTTKEPIPGKEDVFRLKNYVLDALIFTGRDAPHKANYAAHLLVSEGHAFNILVNKDEVYVIGRNPEREHSICIQRNVGNYEEAGIGLLGDIEERVGNTKVKIKGANIFTNMTYEMFGKNIRAASVDLESIARRC